MTRVLVVDDEANIRESLEEILREEGYGVASAPTAAEAKVLIEDAPYDVVLLDIWLPDRDGLDDLRRVSADNPRPIVMFVDRDDRGFMEEAIAAGVSSYNVVDTAFPDIKPIVMAAVAQPVDGHRL